MCFGPAPQAPQVVYQGPSDAEIAANQSALDTYKTQMGQQQEGFQKSLQQQIDAANKQTQELQTKYQSEAAAAAAAAAAAQQGAYAVTATQSQAPTGAQTTAAAPKKEKPSANLKISLAGTPSSAGSGLNIGI